MYVLLSICLYRYSYSQCTTSNLSALLADIVLVGFIFVLSYLMFSVVLDTQMLDCVWKSILRHPISYFLLVRRISLHYFTSILADHSERRSINCLATHWHADRTRHHSHGLLGLYNYHKCLRNMWDFYFWCIPLLNSSSTFSIVAITRRLWLFSKEDDEEITPYQSVRFVSQVITESGLLYLAVTTTHLVVWFTPSVYAISVISNIVRVSVHALCALL